MVAATLIKYCNPASCRTEESLTPFALITYARIYLKSTYLWFICMPQLLCCSLRQLSKHWNTHWNTQNGISWLGSSSSCKTNKSVCHNVWLVNAKIIYSFISTLSIYSYVYYWSSYLTKHWSVKRVQNPIMFSCSVQRSHCTHNTAAESSRSLRQYWRNNSNRKYWTSYANFGHPSSGLHPLFYYTTHF